MRPALAPAVATSTCHRRDQRVESLRGRHTRPHADNRPNGCVLIVYVNCAHLDTFTYWANSTAVVIGSRYRRESPNQHAQACWRDLTSFSSHAQQLWSRATATARSRQSTRPTELSTTRNFTCGRVAIFNVSALFSYTRALGYKALQTRERQYN